MFYKMPVFNGKFPFVIVEADSPEDVLSVALPTDFGDYENAFGTRCTRPAEVLSAVFESYPIVHSDVTIT